MSLLLPSKPLVIIPELAVRIGLNEAIILQQIHYWLTETSSGVEYDGRKWIYNTLQEWLKQFPFLSESTIKRVFASLKKRGCLYIKQLSSNGRDKTNYYAINYEHQDLFSEVKLALCNSSNCTDAVGQNDPPHQVKMTRCSSSKCPALHTEITTETTTDIKTSSSENSVEFTTDDPKKNSLDDLPGQKPKTTNGISTPAGKYHGTAEDLEVAQWIYQKTLEINPTLKTPNWPHWANDIRLMRTRDGRTHDDICKVFSWANNDRFWQSNILCPFKLRKQWDTLVSQMLASKNKPPPKSKQNNLDWNSKEWAKGMKELT